MLSFLPAVRLLRPKWRQDFRVIRLPPRLPSIPVCAPVPPAPPLSSSTLEHGRDAVLEEIRDRQAEEVRDLVQVLELHATIPGQDFAEPGGTMADRMGEILIRVPAPSEQGTNVLHEGVMRFHDPRGEQYRTGERIRLHTCANDRTEIRCQAKRVS